MELYPIRSAAIKRKQQKDATDTKSSVKLATTVTKGGPMFSSSSPFPRMFTLWCARRHQCVRHWLHWRHVDGNASGSCCTSSTQKHALLLISSHVPTNSNISHRPRNMSCLQVFSITLLHVRNCTPAVERRCQSRLVCIVTAAPQATGPPDARTKLSRG